MSIKTLELEIERMKLQKELSKQRHLQRMEELKIMKEIEELRKDHTITKRFEDLKEQNK